MPDRLATIVRRARQLAERALFHPLFGVIPVWYVYALLLTVGGLSNWQSRGGPTFFEVNLVQDAVIALVVVGLTLTRVERYRRAREEAAWRPRIDTIYSDVSDFLTDTAAALYNIPLPDDPRMIPYVARSIGTAGLWTLTAREEEEVRNKVRSIGDRLERLPPSLRSARLEDVLSEVNSALETRAFWRSDVDEARDALTYAILNHRDRIPDSFWEAVDITLPDDADSTAYDARIGDALRAVSESHLAYIIESLLAVSPLDIDPVERQVLRVRASGLRVGESHRFFMRDFLAGAWLEIQQAARDEIARILPSTTPRLEVAEFDVPAGPRWSWVGRSLSPASDALYVSLTELAGSLPVCPDSIGANAFTQPLPKVQWSVVSIRSLDELGSLLTAAANATVTAGAIWVIASDEEDAWPTTERVAALPLLQALRESGWIDEAELRLGAGLISVRSKQPHGP